MTGGDVLLELQRDPRLSWNNEPGSATHRAALQGWGAILRILKPDCEGMPMSPLERRRARDVLLALLDAIDRAELASPSHFHEVPRSSPAEFDEDEFGVRRRKRTEER